MSIDFKSTKGIFQQIADNLCQQMLEAKLKPGDRVPSVRDLAVEFEVNRNTLLRTFSILVDAGIIVNKRGIGFFVAEKALELIHANEKKTFFLQDLPDFIQKVQLLKINETEVQELIEVLKMNSKK